MLNLLTWPMAGGEMTPVPLIWLGLNHGGKKIIFVLNNFLKKICLQAVSQMELISLGCFMLDVLKIDMSGLLM